MVDVKQREAELKASHKDMTAPEEVTGRTGDSLRKIKGFENITDDHLAERASFNLRDHMKAVSVPGARVPAVRGESETIDISKMSDEELAGLRAAAETEQKNREGGGN